VELKLTGRVAVSVFSEKVTTVAITIWEVVTAVVVAAAAVATAAAVAATDSMWILVAVMQEAFTAFKCKKRGVGAHISVVLVETRVVIKIPEVVVNQCS
jgi:hypothetical protein